MPSKKKPRGCNLCVWATRNLKEDFDCLVCMTSYKVKNKRKQNAK